VKSVFVPVSDIARSIDFYEKALGLCVEANWGEYVDMRFPASGAEAAGVALYRQSVVPSFEHVTFNLGSDDVEWAHQQLSGAGFDVSELKTLGNFLHFELEDPDGHVISIIGSRQSPID